MSPTLTESAAYSKAASRSSLRQHGLEQNLAARLDLRQGGALDLRRHDALRRHGRFGLREGMTGHKPGHGQYSYAGGVTHIPPKGNFIICSLGVSYQRPKT